MGRNKSMRALGTLIRKPRALGEREARGGRGKKLMSHTRPSPVEAMLLPGLAALRLHALASIDADGEGRKRKAKAAANAPPRAHWGLSVDSTARLSFIALSRLLRSSDEQQVSQVAASPLGVALLAALRAAVLRVAVEAGGADPALGETSVATLFNLAGSTFASQSRYDTTSGLSLPSKLPWRSVKALVRALLDSLTASLLTPEGSALQRSMLALPFAPLDASAQASIAALVASVERDTTSRLLSTGGGGSSSSSSSVWPSLPPSQPPPSQPTPSLPQAPPVPPPPFAIDATLSLAGNARRVVQARLGRPMTTAEGGALDAGLMVALSLLLPGGEAVRRGWLDSNVLAALSTQATAQLWACVLDASGNDRSDRGGDSRGVDAFDAALTDAASAIAGMQLASAFGL